ncbi:MAG: hypothetical protein M9934_05475 [Thermomicrobiales bacterium]|nr:hypothetical protein [Thermomicrobiales bacterium]
MSFSVHLRSIADDIWEAQHRHPVVTGIGDGSLDPEIFGFWLRQDYLYLIDYARLFGAAVLKAPSLELMTTMAQLAHEILHTEMALHRSYVAEFGITEADLLHETKAPTCQGYTDFLLRTATIGDFAELMGALLPCMWGYGEIGARLAANGCPDERALRSLDRDVRQRGVPATGHMVPRRNGCRLRGSATSDSCPCRGSVHHLQSLRTRLLADGMDSRNVVRMKVDLGPIPGFVELLNDHF